MTEKQINMSDAQYILSTKLILVPFLQIKISRASTGQYAKRGKLACKRPVNSG